MACNGASVLVNLSASNELIGKVSYRRELVQSQSSRCMSAYLYSSAAMGESTTDIVFSGHCIIAENGSNLGETSRFELESQMCIRDIDIERLNNERIRSTTYAHQDFTRQFRHLEFTLPPTSVVLLTSGDVKTGSEQGILRKIKATPFVDSTSKERTSEICEEIFKIQTAGLIKRLQHVKSDNIVIGISGGLDSTLALLVCVKAFKRLKKNLKGIHAITMPGLGTTERTKNNAQDLCERLGLSFSTIDIKAAVRQHFSDIGQSESKHDITYENSQARERTQILMDYANKVNGFVIGTGDLSELCLGWCTYNGDHMSNYGVNSSIPKTLVIYLVRWCAEVEYGEQHENGDQRQVGTILRDICDTPVSPELLPAASDGTIAQVTEDTVGPYILHDFFIFNILRYHFSPRKVFLLALQAFAFANESNQTTAFPPAIILKWLEKFYWRFFTQQFKRSCLPDGVKVGTIAISPRGDWRMPSDAMANCWIREVEAVRKEFNILNASM
jgi:NAD+ synthase (glutamine-hydrolysing)